MIFTTKDIARWFNISEDEIEDLHCDTFAKHYNLTQEWLKDRERFLREFRMKMFLKDLAELTEKYKLEIGGCGCNDSPWVGDTGDEDGIFAGNLSYDKETKTYKVDKED